MLARKMTFERPHFEAISGCLYHENPHKPEKWCPVVPERIRPRLLHETHGVRFAGHFGEKRVYDLLRRYYWWSGMRADVRHHCRACLVCASLKGKGLRFETSSSTYPSGWSIP